jgi:hypothetical protein
MRSGEQRLGADRTDDLGEVSTQGVSAELPDTVTPTPHESKRTLVSRGDFFLIVAAGLQRGSTTRVRIFSDPLYPLEIVPDRRISLSECSRTRLRHRSGSGRARGRVSGLAARGQFKRRRKSRGRARRRG